jgi:hypothetical protein
MDVAAGRKSSASHEARWLNLVGYSLRPGYGMAVDDWRVGEVWRQVHGKLAFASGGSRGESMILWRRIAGGLTAGQQGELLSPWMSMLTGKAAMAQPTESAELWRMIGSLERLPPAAKVEPIDGEAIGPVPRRDPVGHREVGESSACLRTGQRGRPGGAGGGVHRFVDP